MGETTAQDKEERRRKKFERMLRKADKQVRREERRKRKEAKKRRSAVKQETPRDSRPQHKEGTIPRRFHRDDNTGSVSEPGLATKSNLNRALQSSAAKTSLSVDQPQSDGPIHSNPFAPNGFRPLRGTSPFYPTPMRPPAGGLDPDLFPPGMNVDAIVAEMKRQSMPSSPVTSGKPRRITAADLEAVMYHNTRSDGSQRVERVPSLTTASFGEGKISESKAATLADAEGLTEKQILTEKLYQPRQLQWLQEAGRLKTLYKGKFSDEEQRKMWEAMKHFCSRNRMELSEGLQLLSAREKGYAAMYAAMTTAVAASIEGRSLRAVRRYVLETFHPAARRGAWTTEGRVALVQAVQELGTKWIAIGQRIGRLPRDCRTRWRDHGKADRAFYQEHRSQGTPDVVAGGTADSAKPATSIKTCWSDQEINLLCETVAYVCEKMSMDANEDGSLPWALISSKVGTRSPSGCQRKWKEIQSQLKRGFSDKDIASNRRSDGQIAWVSARDDKALVEGLWQQERAIQGNDEKLIDWSVIPCDELPFAQNELSKAWSRLKRKYLTTAEAQSQPLKHKLADLKIVTADRHRAWLAKTQRAETSSKKDGWSKARRKAHEKRKLDEQLASPTGSPTKRTRRMSSVIAGDEASDHKPASPLKKRGKGKGTGRGGAYETDLGDVIDSDEE